MVADWHYYRLIAPHSGSSPFEDQSGGVPLCAPTLINPEWTSIKLTVQFVHLSLAGPSAAFISANAVGSAAVISPLCSLQGQQRRGKQIPGSFQPVQWCLRVTVCERDRKHESSVNQAESETTCRAAGSMLRVEKTCQCCSLDFTSLYCDSQMLAEGAGWACNTGDMFLETGVAP